MMCQKPDRQGGPAGKEALADARASDMLFDRSVNSQPAYPAIRENVESHVRSSAVIHDFIKQMTSVSLQFCARQYGLPGKLRILQSLERYIDCVATFQRTTLGKISLEPRSINFETPDVAGFAELNNRPVKPRATSSFGLPAITHVERAPGHDQI